jgi:hypothetical protein
MGVADEEGKPEAAHLDAATKGKAGSEKTPERISDTAALAAQGVLQPDQPPNPPSSGQVQPPGDKTELQTRLAEIRELEKVSNKLAELETFTWTTAEQSVLNLQIVLRRKYEGAGASRTLLRGQGRKTLALIVDRGGRERGR